MADNYLERQRAAYEKRKADWLKRKKEHQLSALRNRKTNKR